MQTLVPLIDGSVQGPLGVAHLPRLWLKRLLAGADRLPDGYVSAAGWDLTLLDAIGLDAVATFEQLDTRPAYLAFEAWVRDHAAHLDAASIDAANEATRSVEHDEPALEDWTRVHRAAVAGTLEPIVPAISSQSAGALGLRHLPRFWLKALLDATGALAEGWKSGPASPLDQWFAGATQIDVQAATELIASERPSYPEFERWFAARAGNVSPEAIAAIGREVVTREKPERVAAPERALLGIDDPDYRPSCTLNDLMDWHALHARLS